MVRSKILVLVLFFSIGVVALSTFYGSVSVGDQVAVIKDFGLFSVSLFSVLFCVISGASLLHKELNEKTIYNILGKAVYRGEFLIGKFLGMVAIGFTLLALMGSLLTLYLFIYEGHVSVAVLQAYVFIFLELCVVSAAAIFFSSIVVTPVLSGLFTLGFFIAGRSSAQMLVFAERTDNVVMHALYWAVPHLDLLYTGNEVVYNQTRSLSNVSFSTLYVLAYCVVLLAFSSLFFNKRDFN
jgi:ABC-type transport system involved in multi-copper enzyme maturation permease subunit